MQFFNTIFTAYDKLLAPLSSNLQILCAFIILAALILTFLSMLRRGHWIFLVLFVIFFPGAWTALRIIGNGAILIIKFLITRIGFNL